MHVVLVNLDAYTIVVNGRKALIVESCTLLESVYRGGTAPNLLVLRELQNTRESAILSATEIRSKG